MVLFIDIKVMYMEKDIPVSSLNAKIVLTSPGRHATTLPHLVQEQQTFAKPQANIYKSWSWSEVQKFVEDFFTYVHCSTESLHNYNVEI